MMAEHLLIELSEAFVKLHRNQLDRNGIPEHYWNALCTKLKDDVNYSLLFCKHWSSKVYLFLILDIRCW